MFNHHEALFENIQAKIIELEYLTESKDFSGLMSKIGSALGKIKSKVTQEQQAKIMNMLTSVAMASTLKITPKSLQMANSLLNFISGIA